MFNRLKTSPIYEYILPIYGMYEVVRWYALGNRLPVPHAVKRKTIRDYARRYELKTLIETGTYLGNMTAAMAKVFDKIITIELDPVLYKRAKNKFRNLKNIQVLEGDSGKVLPGVLKKIKGPTLFWLDAHYSGGVTIKGEDNSPVFSEIKAIFAHNIKKHVVLIDDADLFVGNGGYPKLSKLRRLVRDNANYSMQVADNVIVLTPKA